MVVHATHESPLKGNFGEVGIDGLTGGLSPSFQFHVLVEL